MFNLLCADAWGENVMNEELTREWLVDIFITYQEAIDERRNSRSPLWLKEALEDDRQNRSSVRDSAARLDSL